MFQLSANWIYLFIIFCFVSDKKLILLIYIFIPLYLLSGLFWVFLCFFLLLYGMTLYILLWVCCTSSIYKLMFFIKFEEFLAFFFCLILTHLPFLTFNFMYAGPFDIILQLSGIFFLQSLFFLFFRLENFCWAVLQFTDFLSLSSIGC